MSIKAKPAYVVGLTGGIGSGKTTVSDLFEKLGITVADADVVARTIVEPGRSAHSAIKERFGESILLGDGHLDRAKLRQIIFSNQEDRRWLERQTHGPIMQMLGEIIKSATSPYSILVLSAGAGRSPLINKMLVVDTPEELQISRVTKRDTNNRQQVESIMASQPTREERLTWADNVIVNEGSMDLLEQKVLDLHQYYSKLADDVI
jgi:dephospho-CoA kinase